MDAAAKSKLKDDILDILRDCDSMVQSFRRQVENKQVLIFVGNTRNGKSTLINYVTGAPLVAFQEGHQFKIRLAEGAKSGATIGQGSLSHTRSPTVFEMQGTLDSVIVDAPGFDDNRGTLQEITNALYINQIKHSAGVRFVLVSDIANIVNDNINGFLSFIETVHRIMPDFDKLRASTCLIFTKDCKKYDVAHIVQLLKTKILDEDGLRCKKNLIRYLVENPHLVGLFNQPTSAGPLPEEIEVNVHGAITRSTPLLNLNDKVNIKFGISTSARIVLLETYLDFFDTVIFAKETFENFKTFTLNRFRELGSSGLLEFTDRQLNGEGGAEEIMRMFSNYLRSVESSVTSASQIPDALNILFDKEVAKVAASLEEIGIQGPISLQITFAQIHLLRKKLDYIACIEKVVEKDNKSQDILTCYKDSTRSFCDEIQQIHQNILMEVKTREHLTLKLKCVPAISTVLPKVNEQYLCASSKGELLKMKRDLKYYLDYSKKIIESIEERPGLKLSVMQYISSTVPVRWAIENQIRAIDIQLENQNIDEESINVSPLTSWMGTLMLYAGVAYVRGFSNMTHLKVIAGSFLLFAACSWKSVYMRKKLSRLRRRYQQGRLLRSRTYLDNCWEMLAPPRR